MRAQILQPEPAVEQAAPKKALPEMLCAKAHPNVMGLIEHDPRAVYAQLQTGEAILVDVREINEYENERIPGALLMPLSFFTPEHFPVIANQRVILMCAVGKRSAVAAKQLMKVGFASVHHMKGGLNAWKQDGLSTETD